MVNRNFGGCWSGRINRDASTTSNASQRATAATSYFDPAAAIISCLPAIGLAVVGGFSNGVVTLMPAAPRVMVVPSNDPSLAINTCSARLQALAVVNTRVGSSLFPSDVMPEPPLTLVTVPAPVPSLPFQQGYRR